MSTRSGNVGSLNRHEQSDHDEDSDYVLLDSPEHHDTRAYYLEITRWVLLSLIMFGISILLIYQYSLRDKNFTVHTDIEASTNSIDTPYFYFMAYSDAATNFEIDLIHSAKNDKYQVRKYNASDFSYENDNNTDDKWSVVHLPQEFLGLNTSQIVVIPPKKMNGNVIERGDILYINTSVYDSDLSPYHYPGIFWDVDSVQDGIVNTNINNITAAVQTRFSSSIKQQPWSPYNVHTMSSLTVSLEIDAWKEKWLGAPKQTVTNTYYSAHVQASIKHNLTGNAPDYQVNTFAFYLNPTGAGIRTNITTEKGVYITEVLGDIGGYFSLVLSISSVVLTVLIFGCSDCFENPWFGGFAPKRRMTGVQRRQTIEVIESLRD